MGLRGSTDALRWGGVAWSPDGTKLAFLQHRAVDLDGAVVGSTGHDPAWSPDGKWLVSVVDERDYDGSNDEGPEWQIVVSSLDGTAIRELTEDDPHPGERLLGEPVLVAGRDADRGLPAQLLRRVGRGLVAVVPLPPVGTGPPRVLRRGYPSCVVSGRDEARLPAPARPRTATWRETTLYVSRGDGSQARSLSVSAADPWGAPVWAPKGGRLAYASERTGQIEMIAVDGSGRRRVTHEFASSGVIPFAWPGDAGRILYTAAVVPEHSHIWTMSPAGTGFKRLTRSRRDEGDPAWSPDGRQIAFTRWFAPNEHKDATGAIYTIRRDGTHEKHLLGGPESGLLRVRSGPGRRTESGSPSSASHSTSRTMDSSSPTQTGATRAESPKTSTQRRRRLVARWQTHRLHNRWLRSCLSTQTAGARRRRSGPPGRLPRPCLVTGRATVRAHLRRHGTEHTNNPRGVYVMNVNGSDLHRVIEDESAASPTWSPDGTTIVFAGVSCLPAGSFDRGICAVETDGSGLRALTAFGVASSSPNWSTTRPRSR